MAGPNDLLPPPIVVATSGKTKRSTAGRPDTGQHTCSPEQTRVIGLAAVLLMPRPVHASIFFLCADRSMSLRCAAQAISLYYYATSGFVSQL